MDLSPRSGYATPQEIDERFVSSRYSTRETSSNSDEWKTPREKSSRLSWNWTNYIIYYLWFTLFLRYWHCDVKHFSRSIGIADTENKSLRERDKDEMFYSSRSSRKMFMSNQMIGSNSNRSNDVYSYGDRSERSDLTESDSEAFTLSSG